VHVGGAAAVRSMAWHLSWGLLNARVL
jgi:hypothetical protein